MTVKTKYTVVAAYLGECCMSPHAWVEKVSADDKVTAEEKLRLKLQKKGFDVGDVFVIEGR